MTEAELPLRIVERDGNPIIKCLCGAEVAAVRSHRLEMTFSPAALFRMILHARKCTGRAAPAREMYPRPDRDAIAARFAADAGPCYGPDCDHVSHRPV